MPSVIIGRDTETRQEISIGDTERRSGLYLLGRPGAGKTTLIKNIISQDIANGHGVFFLDPHGDAIDDLQKRIPPKRQQDVIVLDPADEHYSFGMNLLACPDPHNMTQLTRTFAPAIEVFKKLFANVQTEELDILLNQYLRNSFFPLIANQGYTLAEIPLFLTNKQFRDRLLQDPSIRPQVVRFWHDVFDRLPQDDQRKEIASTLRRLDIFEDYDQIRHIVGQSASTLHFSDIMDKGKILFIKLSATLPPDVKRIIGTILVSNLVHAVLLREQVPEEKRRHFCIFVDEFQNFASSDDFAVLFTQARKYAIATTIAHQERYGQFADNQRISGATDAAVNKIFFQVSVRDAREQAAEFAKKTEATENRREAHLLPSPHVVEDLWEKGHPNQYAMAIREKYFWIVDLLRSRPNESEYVFSMSMVKPGLTEKKTAFVLAEGEYHEELRTTPQMIREGLSILNKYYYDCMLNGWNDHLVTEAEVAIMFQAVMKLGRIFGFFPSMRIYKKSDPEDKFSIYISTKAAKDLLKETLDNAPLNLSTDTWATYEYTLQGHAPLAEIVRLAANVKIYDEQNNPENKRRYQEAYQDYIAHMSIIPMQSLLGVGFQKLPYETRMPHFERVAKQISWQLSELQAFIHYCFLIIPYTLAREPIKVQSGRYDESLKVERTQQDLVNEMAQELIDLRPHTAYVKSAWKGKIQTLGVAQAPGGQLVDVTVSAWSNAIVTGILKPRTDIEEEIRERQETWGRRRGNEPPPPTHTGGNTPPSSGSAGSDREPPPTHYTPEKTPEEKPRPLPKSVLEFASELGAQVRDWTSEKGSQIKDQPPLSPEKPSGNSDVSRPETGPYTRHATEEKSMLPPLRPRSASTPTRPRPSLKFESLRFFESMKGMPPDMWQRRYGTGFRQQTTRYINFDLTMRNGLYRQRNEKYLLNVRYYNPDGSLLAQGQEDILIKSDSGQLIYQYGRGWEEPGHWGHGTYRVEILIDGVKFAEGSFGIE